MRKKYDGDVISISKAKERIVTVGVTKNYLKTMRNMDM
jgi:hypothetical protein